MASLSSPLGPFVRQSRLGSPGADPVHRWLLSAGQRDPLSRHARVVARTLRRRASIPAARSVISSSIACRWRWASPSCCLGFGLQLYGHSSPVRLIPGSRGSQALWIGLVVLLVIALEFAGLVVVTDLVPTPLEGVVPHLPPRLRNRHAHGAGKWGICSASPPTPKTPCSPSLSDCARRSGCRRPCAPRCAGASRREKRSRTDGRQEGSG